MHICNPSCLGYLDHGRLNLGNLMNLSETRNNTTQNCGTEEKGEKPARQIWGCWTSDWGRKLQVKTGWRYASRVLSLRWRSRKWGWTQEAVSTGTLSSFYHHCNQICSKINLTEPRFVVTHSLRGFTLSCRVGIKEQIDSSYGGGKGELYNSMNGMNI